ncbi:hypothetical protein IRJ41_018701 [Triplophysa rosa]|uniref:HECT domain-containing protein n=1 Tax=Triplophysa rosa TaxID=992332 RepID=A0A9W8CBU8_TRIRA|nr:hypothetical protein IRJ41_018701 [Triplophysa rosa]
MEDDLQLFLRSRHVPEDSIIRMNREKMGSEIPSPPDVPHARNHLSHPMSSGNIENPKDVHAFIHRVKVVEDLLAVFVDSNIIKSTLKMDFVNESAVDDAGVSREVYTAFWDQFLEQCEGEDERIPRLRPDFSEVEWEAVGRIWDPQGTLEECDEEDLLDLFTRMGSHCIPPKNNMEVAIQTMAHKAILQEPKYIIDCFSKTMQFALLKVPDQESLLSLYDTKKATGKKVVQLLQSTQMIRSQKEQTVFNHLQRYVRNADQSKAEKILRFCTGSSVICVDQIKVSFNAESGLSRRPVAHTYFRTEFDNILSSDYFEMNILLI